MMVLVRLLVAALVLMVGIATAGNDKLLSSDASAGALNGNRRFVGMNLTSIMQMVPLVIMGEGWSQKLIFMNVDNALPAHGMMYFQRRDGSPWSIRLKLTGGTGITEIVDTAFWFDLQVGQMVTFETIVSYGPQELGMAYVANRDEYGIGRIFGQTVFRKQMTDRPDLMTSMTLSGCAVDWLVIPFDNTDWKYPGVGIVPLRLTTGTEGQPMTYSMRILTTDGTVDKTVTRTASNFGLDWFSLVHEHPETTNKVGMIRISVPPSGTITDPIRNRLFMSAVSLQFAPNGAFTAISPFESGDILDAFGGDPR